MTEHRQFSLATAFEAAEQDRLARWVGDFLASRGSDNATLAAGLAQERTWWLGPLRVPLSELTQLAGPEDEDVLCPVEPDEWEEDVDAMEESIEQGWEPPPLLAEFRDGQLLVQDGNHRYEALERAGESHTWVLIWFTDETERERYSAEHPAADQGRAVPKPSS
jgi:hypothetical protein